MKTIHKYVLDKATNHVHTREGATFLHAATQYDQVTVWAQVHTLQRETTRRLYLIPTGGDIPTATDYVGTALLDEGRLVLHVYADREAGR